MNELNRLAQDLRAHVHEVPAHISRVMREAAAALDEQSRWVTIPCDVIPPPFPPPGADPRGGKHHHPRESEPC